MPLRDLWLWASAFLIFIGLAAGQGTLAVLGVMLLLAGGAARVWQRLALERLTYQRLFAETRAFVGEKLPYTVRLTNRKPLPLPWLQVRDLVPEDLPPIGVRLTDAPVVKAKYLTRLTAMSWYERLSWRYELECRKRGYYRIGPAHISKPAAARRAKGRTEDLRRSAARGGTPRLRAGRFDAAHRLEGDGTARSFAIARIRTVVYSTPSNRAEPDDLRTDVGRIRSRTA
jgi:uncharacterized protein (DUF58 family)